MSLVIDGREMIAGQDEDEIRRCPTNAPLHFHHFCALT